jgi:hypothetical protein
LDRSSRSSQDSVADHSSQDSDTNKLKVGE